MDDPTTRPIGHLRDVMRQLPDLPRMVDLFRAGKGTEIPDWPAWCLLPMAGWHAIVTGHQVPDERWDWDVSASLGIVAAIGTWRYTQGVYVMDTDLRASLEQTDIAGILPADVMTRLPEWCLYLATPGMTTGPFDVAGVYVHLEHDVNDGDTELRLVLDCADGMMVPIPIHLGPWSLREALARTTAQAGERMGTPLPASVTDELVAGVAPIVSMLLYLCSDEPEVAGQRQPGVGPHNPQPKRVKRGWRLFPPHQPTVWTVGSGIGQQLREDRAASQPTGRTVRPHIRRGHWHGYWRGPRDGARTFHYHWLPPMVVAGRDDD